MDNINCNYFTSFVPNLDTDGIHCNFVVCTNTLSNHQFIVFLNSINV